MWPRSPWSRSSVGSIYQNHFNTANMENNRQPYKYPLDRSRIASIFCVEYLVTGVESIEDYKSRVKAEFASYLWCICLLRRMDKIRLAHQLGISIRSMDRYIKEIPLPDTFLEYLYLLQL